MAQKHRLERYHGYLYIAPWLIGFLVLTLYPFVTSLFYSFTKYDIFSWEFAGLKNYVDIFTKDKIFANSLRRTLIYTVIAVPLKLAIALAMATLLARPLRGIGLFRTVYYVPSLLGSSVALSIIWKYLFKSDGLVNMLLKVIGVTGPNWLGDYHITFWTMVLLPMWQMGSPMVIFLAALKTVPEELTEAASIDGANPIQRYFGITLPMISPVIFFNIIMQTIEIIQLFTPAYIITKGGPAKSTYLYALMLYDTSFRDFKMGYASALSWVLFVIIIAFTLLLFRKSSSWVYYKDGEGL